MTHSVNNKEDMQNGFHESTSIMNNIERESLPHHNCSYNIDNYNMQPVSHPATSTTRLVDEQQNLNTSPILRKVNDLACRICYEGDDSEMFISPCRCTGSVASVHQSCMVKWLTENGRESCELCNAEIPIRKIFKTFREYLASERFAQLKKRITVDLCKILIILATLGYIAYFEIRCGMNFREYETAKADNDRLSETFIYTNKYALNSTFPDQLDNKKSHSNKTMLDLLEKKWINLNSMLSDKADKEKIKKFEAPTIFDSLSCIILFIFMLICFFHLWISLRFHKTQWINWRNETSVIGIDLKSCEIIRQ